MNEQQQQKPRMFQRIKCFCNMFSIVKTTNIALKKISHDLSEILKAIFFLMYFSDRMSTIVWNDKQSFLWKIAERFTLSEKKMSE